MVGRTKTASKAQRKRFQDLQGLGCLTCWIAGHGYRQAEIHHLIDGGRRLGHDHTLALCAWCHRSVPDGHLAPSGMEHYVGPSLAINSREFHARYGDDEALLALQEERLDAYRKNIIGRSA